MNDIKGLDVWEGETKDWNKKAGTLKTRAGIGIIDALESWYKSYQTHPTPVSYTHLTLPTIYSV